MRNVTRLIVLLGLIGPASGPAFGQYPYTGPGSRGGSPYDPLGIRTPGRYAPPDPFGGVRLPGMPAPYDPFGGVRLPAPIDPFGQVRIPGLPSPTDPFGQRTRMGGFPDPLDRIRVSGVAHRRTEDDDRRPAAALTSVTIPQTASYSPPLHIPHVHVPHMSPPSPSAASSRVSGRWSLASAAGGLAGIGAALAALFRRPTRPTTPGAGGSGPVSPSESAVERQFIGLGKDGQAGALVRDVPGPGRD